jgi:hypothetical protein
MLTKKQKTRKYSLEKSIKKLYNYCNDLWNEYNKDVQYMKVCYRNQKQLDSFTDQQIRADFKKLMQRFNYFINNVYPYYLKYIGNINKEYEYVISNYKKHSLRDKGFTNSLYEIVLSIYPYDNFIKKSKYTSDNVIKKNTLKYVAVIEHKRNRVNFNIIFFNLPKLHSFIIRRILGNEYHLNYYYKWIKELADLIDTMQMLIKHDYPYKTNPITSNKMLHSILKKEFVPAIKSNFKFHRYKKSHYFHSKK